MILQELVRYYERKAKDSETALAPDGFEKKEVPFLIIVDANGRFLQIEDTRTVEGKKRRTRTFLHLPWPARARGGVLRRSRFNEEQIIAILKESEGVLAASPLSEAGKREHWKNQPEDTRASDVHHKFRSISTRNGNSGGRGYAASAHA